MRLRHRGVAALALSLVAFMQGVASAAVPTAAEDAASRQRIRVERQRANADYAAREAACKQRFVVASCLTDAAVARRGTLERLQEEEATINERQRATRADVATRRVADKKEAMRKAAIEKEAAARDAAAKPGSPAGKAAPVPPDAGESAAGSSGPSDGRGPGAAPNPRKPPKPSKKQPTTSNIPSAAKQEKTRADYDRRLQDAEKHRREVEARNAANASKKKPGNPLPPPEEQ